MAVTMALSSPDRITLGGVDALTRIDLPANGRTVRLSFVANAGKIAYTGTDGAAIGTDFLTAAAGAVVELPVPGSVGRARSPLPAAERVLYLASGTGSTVVEVLVLP